MAISRAFAFNSSTAIPGCTQVGNIAAANIGATSFTNSVTWYNGPDESLGYVIAYEASSQPKPDGGFARVQFWRSSTQSDSSFISLANFISNRHGSPQNFVTASVAKDWLNSSGYWTSYTYNSSSGIVTNGLRFNLDVAPSSGTTWNDSSGNGYNATINGSASYVSNNGGGIKIQNTTYTGTGYISVPYNITNNAVTVEIVASFNPTTFWATIWGNEVYNSDTGYFAYLGGATSLYSGKPTSQGLFTITSSNSIRHWTFVINNTKSSVFLNGAQVGTTASVTNQTLFGSNNFYFGSRHSNVGTGATDKLNSSVTANQPVFYQMRVYNVALTSAEILQNFNAIKTTYGL